MTPFQKLKEWIEIEKTRGSTHADYIVLATATKNVIPLAESCSQGVF